MQSVQLRYPLNFRMHLRTLDGIRALAVTLVFLEHFGGGAHGNAVLRAANVLRQKGWLGVDIFFVLSGFLITGILHDTTQDTHYLRRFFARRSLRILPLYYGVFLLLGIFTPLLHYQWHLTHFAWLVYLGNVWGNYNFQTYYVFSGNHYAWSANLSHFWSLCVEEQFYLIWPWIVLRIRDRRRLIQAALLLSIGALSLRTIMYYQAGPILAERWIVRTLPFRMDALLIGGILGLLLRGPNARRVQRSCRFVFAIASLCVLAIFILSPSYQSPWLLTVGYSLTAIAAAGLIGASLDERGLMARTFSFKPLQALGKVSYGFYVFHDLFFYVWLALLNRLITFVGGIALAGIIDLTCAYLTTVVVSHISYVVYEKHFLRYKCHFLYDEEAMSRED